MSLENKNTAERFSGERIKTHEDSLLKKIQQEHVQESINSIKKTVVADKEANREHYEDELLNKLMNNLLNPDNSKLSHQQKAHAEMLMITSAVPLSEQEKETIVRKFMTITKKPLRRITTVVDPELITGIRLQSESFYYEVSGQKTLRELRHHMDRSWQS